MTPSSIHHAGAGAGKVWRALVWGGAAALLLLPWVAMQFTGEVAWDRADFALFGAMLLVVCASFELAIRRSVRWSSGPVYLAAVAVALATAFVQVWMNLAVGLIGSEDNPANRIFAGVIAVLAVGAVIARLRPRGMVRALVATALAQALAAVVAALAGWGHVWVLTLGFVLLWLLSAVLFRKAARDPRKA